MTLLDIFYAICGQNTIIMNSMSHSNDIYVENTVTIWEATLMRQHEICYFPFLSQSRYMYNLFQSKCIYIQNVGINSHYI